MRRGWLPAVILAATLATGCATRPGADPPRAPSETAALAGTYDGLGSNRLRLGGGR